MGLWVNMGACILGEVGVERLVAEGKWLNLGVQGGQGLGGGGCCVCEGVELYIDLRMGEFHRVG